jgi:hypothetical protein
MIHEIHIQASLLVSGEEPLPVPSTLRYDSEDPYAIYATFLAGGEAVDWVFSRELLYGGLTNHMGVGDVQAWPSEVAPVMFLLLCSPDGSAMIEMPIPEVRNFLDFTARMVHYGDESNVIPFQRNLDDWIARTLEESS